jgi:glycosyltransferase involved in cell wall biosynthesis
MNETVSVIIPVFNHAGTLKSALKTILNQSYRPIEVVIVNDGSTDNFQNVMNNILSDKSFVELNITVINQENRGAPSARNRGFAASKGEYVIFFDADTIADPQLIEKMKEALDKNTRASYAYSGFKFGWKKMRPIAFDAEKLKVNNFIDVTSLIRRADFPVFDESIKKFKDWDLWLTMLEKNKTGVCLPEILYKKIVGGRTGISQWIPRFVYRLPWKLKTVSDFEANRLIVLKKHGLAPKAE